MSKKSFATAPRPKPLAPETIDAYVQGGTGHDNAPAETPAKAPETFKDVPMKRLSIDLPEEAHRRFKVACAATGRKMGNELTDFIEKRTAELEAEVRK